jgi:ATP-independent RNA helicase DbpA
MALFSDISLLPAELVAHLKSFKFIDTTPIQAAAIEPILAGNDVVAQSKTGSGKTLAFGIPCIVRSGEGVGKPQALVITPTRELAEQIAGQLRSVAAYRANFKILTLYGGVPLRAQADSLARGAHILIGTPGRLMDHISKGTLDLSGIKRLVLDEADRMLDMGFGDDILSIASHLPAQRQTLLFSATYPDSIEKLADTLLDSPLRISVDIEQPVQIDEGMVLSDDKRGMLEAIMGEYRPESLLIFCNTKVDTIALANYLGKRGHSVAQLHGDLDQRGRQESVIAFSNGSRRVLVATDVASRGLDITGIDMVVNYDMPYDGTVYIHRIGRTGRADAVGRAITLCMPRQQEKCEMVAPGAKKIKIQDHSHKHTMESNYSTLCINGGKRQKLRPGDIVGTLSKGIGLDGSDIGDISISETISYVAVKNEAINKALSGLSRERIKKKRFKGWVL